MGLSGIDEEIPDLTRCLPSLNVGCSRPFLEPFKSFGFEAPDVLVGRRPADPKLPTEPGHGPLTGRHQTNELHAFGHRIAHFPAHGLRLLAHDALWEKCHLCVRSDVYAMCPV